MNRNVQAWMETCNYENARHPVGRRTHNHWHGRLETWNLSLTLPLPAWCHLSVKMKMNAWFQPRNTGQFLSHFLKTKYIKQLFDIHHRHQRNTDGDRQAMGDWWAETCTDEQVKHAQT